MGKIILRLDRVMADRKMSLNELSEKVGVANVNLSKLKNGHVSAIRFSTLIALSLWSDGYISIISPLALKVPLLKSNSFLVYCIFINFLNISSLVFCIPGLKEIIIFS